MADLDIRHRRVGLAPTTPLPKSAEQTAVMAVLLQGFADVEWTMESAVAERVLAGLQAMRSPEDKGGWGDAR